MFDLIDRPAMSHPYLSVESLKGLAIEDNLFVLKDIIRGLDAANYTHLRRFMKRYSIPISFGSKHKLVMHIAKYILNFAKKNSMLRDMRNFLLLGPEPFEIIRMEERDYDGILGNVTMHEHFIEAHNWLINNYIKPNEKNIALFTTCASVKPYSMSPNFSVIIDYLSRGLKNPEVVHWLVLSNATAPIPQELHNVFPFYAYESDLSKLNSKDTNEYIKIATQRLEKYLRLNSYDHYIALIRPSSVQRKILEQVERILDLDIIYLPTKETVRRINAQGLGYWSRTGMKHRYTLNELGQIIRSLPT
jgi:hypothetical protein